MDARLFCSETGEYFRTHLPLWQSPSGHLLDLDYDARFDLQKIRSRKPNLWRYREAIPLPLKDDRYIVSFEEGFTPLLPIDFSGKRVWVKQEQLFGTGSYKDRGATVLMSKVRELGIKKVVQDSSGNAGSAIAAYAALAGIACDIYLPAKTSPAKIAQIQASGARIKKVKGSREDTAEAALAAAAQTYYASHSYNPFFFQGTKTFAYEVYEQLNWKVPDSVVLPVGNGTLLLGCYLGFMDLLKAGMIDRMPKLIAVQSEFCAPLAHAFDRHSTSVLQPTIAEGIAIAKPIRGPQILQYVKASRGFFITVSEEDITQAWQECGRKGFYIEPTAAATIAGLKKYIAMSLDETIVSLFSGHGLKYAKK
jgi:threonine synthase